MVGRATPLCVSKFSARGKRPKCYPLSNGGSIADNGCPTGSRRWQRYRQKGVTPDVPLLAGRCTRTVTPKCKKRHRTCFPTNSNRGWLIHRFSRTNRTVDDALSPFVVLAKTPGSMALVPLVPPVVPLSRQPAVPASPPPAVVDGFVLPPASSLAIPQSAPQPLVHNASATVNCPSHILSAPVQFVRPRQCPDRAFPSQRSFVCCQPGSAGPTNGIPSAIGQAF